MRVLDTKRDHELDDDHDDLRGTPGRATLTSRLPPTTRSIARQVMLLQAKGNLDGPDAHEVAAHGMAGAGSTLPFFDQIQRAFGHHDISGVRAHIGGAAGDASSALGARAYASGDSVAFGTTPDLHLAAHEAAHVVQQRGGVRLSGGVGRAGDEYEVNADAVADRVVRGESAQDLLDPFSHRGSSGGPAVQRQEGDERCAGVQDLNRMLLRGAPTPQQIVACMRRHPDDARAILARVRERLGDAVALSVEVEVGMTAPELVPVLGSPHARGTSPVGTEAARPDAVAAAPEPRAPGSRGAPVDLHAGSDSVTATVHPDAHSTVEATVAAAETNPILREVRVVISDSTRGGGASGELEVGADLEEGRGSASISGELRPDGEDGPTLSGEASVSVGAGEHGGVDVRGSGRVEIRVPVGDHAVLREALILTDDGHLRIEAGADLLRRVRGLPEGNAAREPLLRLFMTVDTDIATGERSVSGGGSLEVQFDRDGGDHDDPADVQQLAVSGTRGAGTSLPHLAQIQAAFGHHDITGVRAHVGGDAAAAAGAMGARGYASGNDIAFAASPDLHLAAHEAAHVVQQRGGVRLSGGVGRAGDEYEQHADAVADLVVRGESAQALLDQRAHRGAAGGSAVQLDAEADRAWLATLHRDDAGHYTAADGRELTRPERRRLRRILTDGAAREAPAERPETIERHERLEPEHVEGEIPRTELDEDRERSADETGTSRRPGRRHGGAHDSASGGRIRSTETLEDGTTERTDRIRERRTHSHMGETVERRERGTRTEALHGDGPTMSLDLHDRLVAERAALGPSGVAELRESRNRRRRLDEDIAALEVPGGVSRERAVEIAERHDITVLAEEDVDTTTTVRDLNPLDGSVGTGRLVEHSEVERDGSGRSSSDHRSTRVDLGEGAVERTHDRSRTVTAADGSSTTDTTSTAHRGAIGGGRIDGTRRTRTGHSSTDAEGEETGTAREESTSVGAILSEDETGIRLGSTERRESTAHGVTTASESSAAVEITDRRVGASGSRGGEIRDGDTRGTARVSADGSFSIDVEPIDDGSGRFRLTFTIHIGADGSLGASHDAGSGDRGRSSFSARASARGDLVTSRVITEAEAQRYTAAADRAERGEEVTDPPEFSRLARLRAAGEGADALLSSGAVFGDSGSARDMNDGESITLDMEVGLGADVSLGGTRGGVGADIGAGGDARWRRTMQVERITVGGQPRVRLTVTYHDETEAHASASASVAEVGAARVRGAREAGTTDAVQFVVDPAAADYDERYRRIVGTTDRTQLRALEREYAEDVRRSRHADTGATETEYEFGPTASAMIGTRTRVTSSDDVSVVTDAEGNRSLDAEIEGGTDSDVRVRAGDHDIDVAGHRETVRGTVDRTHGARVDIEAAEESIDPLAAISDGYDALAEADGARERAALVVAHTPTEHLMSALQQFSHVWGYHLDAADLEAMGERAGDSSRWSACCIVPDVDVLRAWTRLRGKLANPHPDAAEALIDRDAAINIVRIRALTSWMRSADSHGAECLERVLRRWGESMTHEVSDERLGDGYEWPVSLRDAHERYTRLVTQAEGMRDRLEAALARPAGNTEALAHYNSVKTGFEAVLREVRGCDDFRSESRRSEMMLEIENHRAEIGVKYRDFERRWAALHSGDTMCGGEGPTDEEIEGTRSSVADRTAERSRAYARAAIRVLEGNHARETRLLQQVQEIMRDVGDSPLFGNSARADAAELCTQVHDLHRTWIQQVQDLRTAYTQANTPESTWQVSTGPGAPRSRTLEPNVGWLIIEYSRVSRFDTGCEGRVAQWREEAREY